MSIWLGGLSMSQVNALEATRLRVRNEWILVLTLAPFVVALAALALEHGFRLTADVLGVVLALGLVVLGRGRARPACRDWSAFLILGLAYELIRGDGAAVLSTVHVRDMIGLERWLFGGVLPTEALQRWLHPAHGLDPVAAVATILYVIHPALPIVVAAFLWMRDKAAYYDYIAALVILSMAAFVTYLIVPVAPPWWAAAHGYLTGPAHSKLASLRPSKFGALAASAGVGGQQRPSGFAFGNISPDQVASFPSLHAGYPFLAFLFARRVLGSARWAVLAYAVAVWFAVVYLGEHYVVDVVAGIGYTLASYVLVVGWERLTTRGATPVGRGGVISPGWGIDAPDG
jgi:hypothetical protein